VAFVVEVVSQMALVTVLETYLTSVAYVTMMLLMTVFKTSVAFGVDQVLQMSVAYVTMMLLMTVFKTSVAFGVVIILV
jgi:hypothetical protein